ncbi:hypothetical protein DICSQDRAFT_136219 [Dichomitus squalens LYAD-421 SS1]|nr:uncharacterized protein DICSQDRAFT_136219 [Dichomitus squalens LYAD-421 SS1]EJF61683.1 hypothetical protein DICSQDRAFT_136219 [Dichomitus squalens LYAD-421 SS1]
MMWKFVHEAWFFKDRLSVVQGEAVPRHYGVWCGKAEWGAELAISIMQFGGYSYLRYFRDTALGKLSFERMRPCTRLELRSTTSRKRRSSSFTTGRRRKPSLSTSVMPMSNTSAA